jgi:O-antigen ligase
MIELPIALLLLSVWYRCVTTKLDIIAISAIFVFQSSLVFYQYLFQGAIMPGGTYHHHGMIGNVMTISLGWHIALFFKAKTKTPKILYAVLSLVALLAILFSESRSSLVGIGISALLFIALHFRLNKMYIFSLLFSLVFAYLLLQYSPLQQTIDRTFNSSPAGLDPSSLGRILIWKGGWNYFVNAPLLIKLFGHGIGQYITVPYEFWVEMGRLTSGAHNNLLHVLIETGIVGLIVFIIVFIKILSELWKIREINLFAKYMFYSTIALLASGLTQETFWFQNSFGSFWLFYICCLSIAFAQNKQFLESDKSSA